VSNDGSGWQNDLCSHNESAFRRGCVRDGSGSCADESPTESCADRCARRGDVPRVAASVSAAPDRIDRAVLFAGASGCSWCMPMTMRGRPLHRRERFARRRRLPRSRFKKRAPHKIDAGIHRPARRRRFNGKRFIPEHDRDAPAHRAVFSPEAPTEFCGECPDQDGRRRGTIDMTNPPDDCVLNDGLMTRPRQRWPR
jgi:hypothetical protein